jgi:hypothetical protein
MKDYCKQDYLKDIEVEGKTGGFKGDWIVGIALMVLLVIAFVS